MSRLRYADVHAVFFLSVDYCLSELFALCLHVSNLLQLHMV